MATDEKLDRKAIKAPDAFQVKAMAFGEKLLENPKPALTVLGAFLVLLIIAGFGSQLSGRKAEQAGGALAKALEVTRRGVEGTSDPLADPDLPKFKTLRERDEELARQLDEVRKQFPGTEAANTASQHYADAQFQLGNFDQAIEAYEAFLKSAPESAPSRSFAIEGIGYGYEAKKDYAKAREAFGKLAADASMKDWAAFHQARVLELEGKKTEAAAAYRQLKADFKESAMSRAAGDRLALLAAQGVLLAPEPKADGQ